MLGLPDNVEAISEVKSEHSIDELFINIALPA